MVNNIRLYAQENIIAFHVSATTLIQNSSPSSLSNHHKLHPHDKQIWDQAYKEEYMDLFQDLDVFKYITKNESKQLKHILGQKLPSIAISTIKRDQNGQPVRAKYRICA
mmetsp:Transcript_12383/g.17658  ORF Transcript_12383/g.17658 Transcript_12383/m.17658 type:complete len:109 (+) Transcript_12383:2250-2576(+)